MHLKRTVHDLVAGLGNALGASQRAPSGVQQQHSIAPEGVDEKQVSRVEAIINSMTPHERRSHQVINGSRRKRIARGSGTTVEEVNRLLRQFVQMRMMLKIVGGASGAGGGRGGMRKRMAMLRTMMQGS